MNFTLNWNNFQDLRYTQPISIKISQTLIYVNSWADLWHNVCLMMEEIHGDISGFHIQGRHRTIFSSDPADLIKPKKLKKSGYIETNYSAKDIVCIVKEILLYYGELLSFVTITVASKEDKTECTLPPETESETKTNARETTKTSAYNSDSPLRRSIFTHEEAELIYTESMKQYTGKASSASVLSKLNIKISKTKAEISLAKQQMMYLISNGRLGIPCSDRTIKSVYEEHKSSQTIQQTADNPSTETLEKEFYNWLSSKKKDIGSYYIALSEISCSLIKRGLIKQNLFELRDVNRIKETTNYVLKSRYGSSRTGADAIRNYSEFMQMKFCGSKAEADISPVTPLPPRILPAPARQIYLKGNLAESLKFNRIRFLDERPAGHLWIFGEVLPFVRECRKHNVRFTFDTYQGTNSAFVLSDGWYTDQELPNEPVSETAPTQSPNTFAAAIKDKGKYEELLRAEFSRGIKLDSAIEMKRFRKAWERHYQSENATTDYEIKAAISSLTITSGGKSYLPETMLNAQVRDKITDYIKKKFSDGIDSIYISAIYDKFSDELVESQISDFGMLKNYLQSTLNGKYYYRSQYISTQPYKESSVSEELRNYLLNAGSICAKEQIFNALSHIPRDRIAYELSKDQQFVLNAKGEYFIADIIDLSDDELQKISEIISAAISEKDYISDTELCAAIENRYPEIYERYSFVSNIGLRNSLKYKLNGKFFFKAKIISAEMNLSVKNVFADFCESNSSFTMEQLNMLKDDLETQIYFDSVYDNSVRISEEQFVSAENVHFDIDEIDKTIERFFCRDYLLFSEISSFMSFPYVGFQWNSFLLESYVYRFSRKFSLSHKRFSKDLTGAIVRKGSKLEDFSSLMAQALADSGIELTQKATVNNWLFRNNLITAHKFSGIDKIIQSAKAIRNSKG